MSKTLDQLSPLEWEDCKFAAVLFDLLRETWAIPEDAPQRELLETFDHLIAKKTGGVWPQLQKLVKEPARDWDAEMVKFQKKNPLAGEMLTQRLAAKQE